LSNLAQENIFFLKCDCEIFLSSPVLVVGFYFSDQTQHIVVLLWTTKAEQKQVVLILQREERSDLVLGVS